MTRPNLIDNSLYYKIKNKFTSKHNSNLSFKMNMIIIVAIIFSLLFIYYLYLEKNNKNN